MSRHGSRQAGELCRGSRQRPDANRPRDEWPGGGYEPRDGGGRRKRLKHRSTINRIKVSSARKRLTTSGEKTKHTLEI